MTGADARHRRNDRSRRFSHDSRAAPGGHHSSDQSDHAQLAVQPHRGSLPARAFGAHRRSGCGEGHPGDQRRDLRALHLRRRQARLHRRAGSRDQSAHPHRQRRLQEPRDDGMAYRVYRRRRPRDQSRHKPSEPQRLQPRRRSLNGPRSKRSPARKSLSPRWWPSLPNAGSTWSSGCEPCRVSSARCPRAPFTPFPGSAPPLARAIGERTIHTSADLCQLLLEEAHVSIVPGSAFGSEGYMRISYATSMANLEKGLDRIERVWRALALTNPRLFECLFGKDGCTHETPYRTLYHRRRRLGDRRCDPDGVFRPRSLERKKTPASAGVAAFLWG